MNQKTLWIILIVVVVVILGFWLYKRNTAVVPEDTATTTPFEEADEAALPPDAVMEDGAGGPATVAPRGAYTDGTYALNTEESSIAWTGSKTLIKNYKDHGTLAFTSGSVVVANGNIVNGSFVVDMNSFKVNSTSNTKGTTSMLEGHLKSADFFDVAVYPTATIALRNVVNSVVTADVTIKDITKTVSFPALISEDGATLTGTATLSINRANWDIRYGSDTFFDNLGDNVIDDKVDLTLTLSATRTQ